jgi:hypothetical protein
MFKQVGTLRYQQNLSVKIMDQRLRDGFLRQIHNLSEEALQADRIPGRYKVILGSTKFRSLGLPLARSYGAFSL